MSARARTVKESEVRAWLDQISVAFFTVTPDGADDYFRTTIDLSRTRGAFDGDAVVGTLRSFPTELTVPGPGAVPASALTAVSVAPTHRRQGLLTEMITADLRDSAERGEVASILLASEYPIYGRFGYGPASDAARYEIATQGLGFTQPSQGAVELVTLPSLRTLAPPIFERFRTSQPGSIGRTDVWWDRVLRQVTVPGDDPRKGAQAVYRSPAGDLEGYVLYEGKLEWAELPLTGTVTVEELIAVTPAAYQALWEYCFNLDLLSVTVAQSRATDEVLPLLVDDARKVRLTRRHDFLWVRILDACAALAARRYGADGQLTIEVRDDLGFAAGRFKLVGGADGATCVPSKASPDLTVPVRVLGSTYLGSGGWSRFHRAGLVDEHRGGAIELADRMFATARAPWCTTYF